MRKKDTHMFHEEKKGNMGGENHLSHAKIIKFRMRFACCKHASYMRKPQISCARMVHVICMRFTCTRSDFACGILWILICEKGKFYMRYTCIMHVKEQCFRNIIACENRLKYACELHANCMRNDKISYAKLWNFACKKYKILIGSSVFFFILYMISLFHPGIC